MKKENKSKFKRIFLTLIGLAFFVFILLEFLIIYTGHRGYKDKKYDYIVVLGAHVHSDSPSLALKYRLDAALKYIENDDDIKIVVSGGQGDDEAFAESYIMKNYLLEHGVDDGRIIEENKSTSTSQNLAFTHDIIGDADILIATNDFHMLRSLLLAKENGFNAEPLNARTPQIIKLQMYIREFFAFLLYYLTSF